MSVSVTLNGTSYTIPQTSETGWGAAVTSWIQAVSSHTLQKSGGAFTLTAEADFGGSFGLKSLYIKSQSANTADAGQIRLSNSDSIKFRNAANSANLALAPGASDTLTWAGVKVLQSGAGYSDLSLTGSILNADISAAAAIVYSKLNLSGSILNADISASAAIAYSKLSLSGSIVNADISASAAIARTKLASGSNSHVLINDGSGVMSSEAQLAISRGGTGQGTASAAFDALSPNTTKGDIIVRSSTTNTRLPVGINGQILTADSSQTLGVKWANAGSPVAPTIQKFTSTGTVTGYVFTVTSANATVGATYTNNGNTYTVLGTIASGTLLFCSGASAPTASGTLTKSAGTGDATISFSAKTPLATYTPTSASILYIDVQLVGGGGSGAQGNGGSLGAAGTSSYFGANLITANGGAGGSTPASGAAAAGGTASIASGPVGIAVAGADGHSPGYSTAGTNFGFPGGNGGSSFFGGGGAGGTPNTPAGRAGATNSGSGGGGGAINGVSNSQAGCGGAAGGYVDARILSSIAASYPYVIGTGGAGSGNAGAGADGVLIVTEYYQ